MPSFLPCSFFSSLVLSSFSSCFAFLFFLSSCGSVRSYLNNLVNYLFRYATSPLIFVHSFYVFFYLQDQRACRCMSAYCFHSMSLSPFFSSPYSLLLFLFSWQSNVYEVLQSATQRQVFLFFLCLSPYSPHLPLSPLSPLSPLPLPLSFSPFSFFFSALLLWCGHGCHFPSFISIFFYFICFLLSFFDLDYFSIFTFCCRLFLEDSFLMNPCLLAGGWGQPAS